MKKIRKTIIFIILSLMFLLFIKEIFAYSYNEPKPKANEVAIDGGGIGMPLNYLLLIRKDAECCVIRFTRNWTDVDETKKKALDPYVTRNSMDSERARDIYEKKYAAYEVYYQGDGSADFSKSNVSKNEYIASWLPMRGPFRGLLFQPGNPYVKCGSFKLGWDYKNCVSFIPPGEGELRDYGFELAPTPWTDIKEVNIKDTRIKWYRYEKRENVFIPIDKLWEK